MAKWRAKSQITSRPLKVANLPDFPVYRWFDTYRWKVLNKGYNFALDLTSIETLHAKLWAFKVAGVLGQNDIWVLAPWLGIEYTIRGKVVASPKSGPCWVLWVRVCLWFFRTPKVFKLRTNQLVVWFVQAHVSN
jgi:hypothetical protein